MLSTYTQPRNKTCIVSTISIVIEKCLVSIKRQIIVRGGTKTTKREGISVSESASTESCLSKGEEVLWITDGSC